MGTLARKHGQNFETYARKECNDLRKAGLALVRKNWRAPEVPEEGNHARIAKSQPDFSGVIEGGRSVVFECKATMDTNSWEFSHLADHQAEHLSEAAELGAVAFVYILDGDRRKWVVPWRTLVNLDRESYPFGVFESHRKREGETWLDTLERLEVV